MTVKMKRQLTTDDETRQSTSSPLDSRLGKCEVCNHADAKYTCPKCEIKSCCINCLNIHKKELNCNGIRDRTKFISLKKMTKMDFMNDYYFLEECTRYVDDRKKDKVKRYTRYDRALPQHLFKLRNAAQERKTTIRFLLPHFTRHATNTTYYDWSENLIYWRIEWIFANASIDQKYVDERCSETKKLYEALDKYLNVENEEKVSMKKCLEMYQSRGVGNLKIFLKAEGIKGCRRRFYELDCKKTLKENFNGKILVEFPIIYVCYDVIADDYDVIDSDEDVIGESRRYEEALDKTYKPEKKSKGKFQTEDEIKQEIEVEKQRKRAERKKRRTEQATELRNLLFTDENQSDDASLSDSDSDSSNKNKQDATTSNV